MPNFDKSSKILLCDDSAVDVACISSQLDAGGYARARIVSDPSQILPSLESEPFDLLLLDIEMSNIDAVELIHQIRQKFSEAELPILIIAATLAAESRHLALAEGANDYLEKPVSKQEVLLRIKNLLAIRSIYKVQLAEESKLEGEVAARTAKLDMLIQSGLMMSMEHDRSKLFQHILIEGKRLLHCDGATMYLVSEQQTLRFAHRTKNDSLPCAEIPLYDGGGNGQAE